MIYKTVVGSHAYGLNTPESDVDYKGIYMQDPNDLLCFRYKQQEGKDEVYYEVRRFLQLASSANPTILEMLYVHPMFIRLSSAPIDHIKRHRDLFLTKRCRNSFGGYAVDQIRKAKGLNKKMNWEKNRVKRKTPLDFCYVYEEGKTIPLLKWLKGEDKLQKWCGLAGLDHFQNCYALYYDYNGHYGEETNRPYDPAGFKGIALDESNSIRLSSIPKEMRPTIIMSYNKDGYSQHCKDYREYTEWLEKRNTQRYVEVESHGQKIDGKHLMHCRRLLDMAIQIAREGTIQVLRPEPEELLKIRRGEVPLEQIIERAEEDIKLLDELYQSSDLPESIDMDFLNTLLLDVRNM